MIRNICLLLITIILLEIPSLGITPPLVLREKEVVWSGEIELQHDVVVPAGTTLSIMPGTKIYGIYDYNDNIVTPEAWQIIVKGELVAAGNEANSIVFDPIPSGLASLKIPLSKNIKTITIAPEKIETEKIRNEFGTFRTTYAALWILLFASITYAIKN